MFFDYLRNIAYFIVFMAAVGVIAPNGNYKKYITLVMGIMLIGIVIRPAFGIFGNDQRLIPMPDIFAGIIPETIEVEDHIEAAFHRQLTSQTAALLSRNGFELVSAQWQTAEDFSHIQQVTLTVRIPEASPTPRPFIRVEPVRIAPYRPSEPDQEPEEAKAIKKLISDFYEMELANIHIWILEIES